MKALAALFLALLLAPAAAPAAVPVADDAVFVEGARYDAVLDAASGAWRLLPIRGADLQVRVDAACRTGTALPPGLWLVSSDALGRPVLLALSSTPLPPGHRGVVPIVGCDAAVAGALAVPAGVAAWLQQHSGVVHVGR
ncbi:hypothetical protein [Arenimonas composti]|uniref:Uncharacterized protein n=1 Tax=Arenimonas composti TR7-09 = DSM 18010 TaxID=1121013 RepID=A0A091C3D1_9GAMM|nr:hypothetical protein [Arenimonas composti]KFN51165.1 hypothetical protein P873_03795 [Arenimonas composti TR7-09 = DSM 18010]